MFLSSHLPRHAFIVPTYSGIGGAINWSRIDFAPKQTETASCVSMAVSSQKDAFPSENEKQISTYLLKDETHKMPRVNICAAALAPSAI